MRRGLLTFELELAGATARTGGHEDLLGLVDAAAFLPRKRLRSLFGGALVPPLLGAFVLRGGTGLGLPFGVCTLTADGGVFSFKMLELLLGIRTLAAAEDLLGPDFGPLPGVCTTGGDSLGDRGFVLLWALCQSATRSGSATRAGLLSRGLPLLGSDAMRTYFSGELPGVLRLVDRLRLSAAFSALPIVRLYTFILESLRTSGGRVGGTSELSADGGSWPVSLTSAT